MAMALPRPEVKLVDSIPLLQSLLDHFTDLPAEPPSLYVDLEGIHLSRHGTISVLTIFMTTTQNVYLVDVFILGSTAFSITNSHGTSLKAILESPTILKVFFDIRNDSDALFSNYQVTVDGIMDLQLMELASRRFHAPKTYVASLAKCIERDLPLSRNAKKEWRDLKESALALFTPESGGRYEVFNERPLIPEMVQYCAQDVALLPKLYEVYNTKLSQPGEHFWVLEVEKVTRKRILESQSEGYKPDAEDKTFGPWDEKDIDRSVVAFNEELGNVVQGPGNNGWHDPIEDEKEDVEDDSGRVRDYVGYGEDMVNNEGGEVTFLV